MINKPTNSITFNHIISQGEDISTYSYDWNTDCCVIKSHGLLFRATAHKYTFLLYSMYADYSALSSYYSDILTNSKIGSDQ